MNYTINEIYKQEKSNSNAILALSCYYVKNSKEYKNFEKIIRKNIELSFERKKSRVIEPAKNGDFNLDYIIYYNALCNKYGGLYRKNGLTIEHPLYGHLKKILSK